MEEKTIINLKCPVCGREDKIEWDSGAVPFQIVEELATQQGWILGREADGIYVPFCKGCKPTGLFYFKDVRKLVFKEVK